MDLSALERIALTAEEKGMPAGAKAVPLLAAGDQGWNVLREDLALPLLLLKRSALAHNAAWMRRFLELSGLKIAPHGKTPMAPQLFARQLDDGAWGLTCATADHLKVYRRFGVPRVLFANQLVGRHAIRFVLDELRRDPEFDFYALVDTEAGVAALAQAAAAHDPGRPLQVLLEVGVPGGRTGCRTPEDARKVARAVHAAAPRVALRGVEGYEGVLVGPGGADIARVNAFYDFLIGMARACADEGLFAAGEVVLSAGCTATIDLVWKRFGGLDLGRPHATVIRSGCYLTTDSGRYGAYFEQMRARTPEVAALGESPRPALELWGYVSSTPEPRTAVLTFGRRDCPYDKGLPVPAWRHRPGSNAAPEPLSAEYRVTQLHDQHAVMETPDDSPLRVGDLVGVGISHPCAAFEKWSWVPIVDDGYNVVEAVKTYF